MKYKIKSLEINAWLIKDLIKLGKKNLPDRVKQALNDKEINFIGSGIIISTLDGTVFAAPDDMLIEGPEGDIYSCREGKFQRTHDKI